MSLLIENRPWVMTYVGGQSAEGNRSGVSFFVHGEERGSVKAWKRIKQQGLRIDNGKLKLIGANPEAMLADERYLDADFNRMFYEPGITDKQRRTKTYKRAQEFKKETEDVDALLDTHNTSNEKSTPLIIAEPHTFDVASQLPIDLIVSGFDKFEPGGTDYWMNRQIDAQGNRKKGICTEAGYSLDPDSEELTMNIIEAFLKARGHIDEETIQSRKKHKAIIDIYIAKSSFKTKPAGFADFEVVTPDILVGTDGTQPIYVRDGDHGLVSATPGKKNILFASKVIREPGQTGFLVTADMPDIIPTTR